MTAQLHAAHLIVTHPITKKTLDLRAPLPADFEAQIAQLRKIAVAQAKAAALVVTPAKSRKKPAGPRYHIHESRK